MTIVAAGLQGPPPASKRRKRKANVLDLSADPGTVRKPSSKTATSASDAADAASQSTRRAPFDLLSASELHQQTLKGLGLSEGPSEQGLPDEPPPDIVEPPIPSQLVSHDGFLSLLGDMSAETSDREEIDNGGFSEEASSEGTAEAAEEVGSLTDDSDGGV